MTINISGILKSPQGSPIQNAEIIFEQTRTSTEVLAGTKFSIITNQSGNYSTAIGVGIFTLKIRYQDEIQYRSIASNVIVTQNMDNYTVNQIIQDQSQLEDVDYDLLQDVLQARDAAQASAAQALASKNQAQNSQSIASTKANEAQASASQASDSQGAASFSATQAANSQSSALSSKNAAQSSQTTASTKANEASSSAAQALASKNAAQTSETNAQASKDQASASAQDAQLSQSAAATSQSTATTKANAAAASQTNAANSQSTATTKAGEASTSQTNAANSQSIATTKAGEASTSQTNAASSQSTATTKANESSASQVLSQKWAANPENSVVSGGLYSALHYAAKAAQAAQTANGQLVWRGGWSAQAGNPPPTPTGTTQDFYRITQAGTILSVQYEAGDYIHWDNLNSIWFKMDGTDSVTSVNGRTGAVVIAKADVGLNLVNNWGASSQTNDASTTTYATTAGVKAAYDLAATKLTATANAVSATKLVTARTINGTNFDGTANITTTNWGTSRNLTIGNTAKAVNGSADISWTLTEIGAAPDGYGLGGQGRNLSNLSCDTAVESGFYGVYGTTSETPYGIGPSGSALVVSKWGPQGVHQTFYRYNADGVWVRRMYAGVWQPWVELYSTSRKPSAQDLDVLALTGGTLRGSLTIQNSTPQLWFQETDNSDQKWAFVADDGGFRLNKNTTGITDDTLVFRTLSGGELELNNPVARGVQGTNPASLARYDYVNSKVFSTGMGTGIGTQPDATTITGGVNDFNLAKTTGIYKVEGSWLNGVDNSPTQTVHAGILEVQQRYYDNITIQKFNYAVNTAGVSNLRTQVRIWANSTEGWSPWTTSGDWESVLTYRHGILRRNLVGTDDSVYPYVSYAKENFRDTLAADAMYTIGEISFRAGTKNRYDPHSGDQMARILGQTYNTTTQGQYEGGLFLSSRVRNVDGSVQDTSTLAINRKVGQEFTHAGKRVGINAGNVTADNFYQNTAQDLQANALTRKDWVESKLYGTIVSGILLTTTDVLDDVKNPGIYKNPTNATAAIQGLNYPVAKAGTLVVLEGAGVTQRYYVYNSSEVYSRGQHSSGSWTQWIRDYNEQFKPTAADVQADPTGTAQNAVSVHEDKNNAHQISQITGLDDALKNAGSIPVLSTAWVQLRTAMWNGFAAADGQLLKRQDYPDAWAAIQASKVPVVTDAEWLADPAKRGCFTLGDGSTTFRLPDYNGKSAGSLGAAFQRGDGLNSLGTHGLVQGDAIRNIQGQVTAVKTGGGVAASGPFGVYKGSEVFGAVGNVDNVLTTFDFSASRVVPTAADNHPVNVTGCWAVKLFGAVQNAGSIDAAGLATQMAEAQSKISVLETKTSPDCFYGSGVVASYLAAGDTAPLKVTTSRKVKGIVPNATLDSFTIKRAGWYKVSAAYQLEPTAYNQNSILSVSRTGAAAMNAMYVYAPANTTTVMALSSWSDVFYFNANDVISFRVLSANNTQVKLWNTGYIHIEELL